MENNNIVFFYHNNYMIGKEKNEEELYEEALLKILKKEELYPLIQLDTRGRITSSKKFMIDKKIVFIYTDKVNNNSIDTKERFPFVSNTITMVNNKIINHSSIGLISNNKDLSLLLEILKERELNLETLKKEEEKDKEKRNKDLLSLMKDRISIPHFSSMIYGRENLTSIFKMIRDFDLIKVSNKGIMIKRREKKYASLSLKALNSWTLATKNVAKRKDILEEICLSSSSFKYKYDTPSTIEEEENFQDLRILNKHNRTKNNFEVELKNTSEELLIPVAPLKPTQAASVLVAGGNSETKSLSLKGEELIIKSALLPIEKSVTMGNTIVTDFAWQPQAGLFNKTRKEFKILK